jgi:transposase
VLGHDRRDFFDLARLAKAPIAKELVHRIDELFAIERAINGNPPEGGGPCARKNGPSQ